MFVRTSISGTFPSAAHSKVHSAVPRPLNSKTSAASARKAPQISRRKILTDSAGSLSPPAVTMARLSISI